MIFWYYRHKEELSDFPEKMGSELNNFKTFYSISVTTSIWVFLLELYEMKVSYTVLRGGVPPISIKYMIGLRNVLRFRQLQMI